MRRGAAEYRQEAVHNRPGAGHELAVAADKHWAEAEWDRGAQPGFRRVAALQASKGYPRGHSIVAPAAERRRLRRTQNLADTTRHTVGN
jgi:hypothetical protein